MTVTEATDALRDVASVALSLVLLGVVFWLWRAMRVTARAAEAKAEAGARALTDRDRVLAKVVEVERLAAGLGLSRNASETLEQFLDRVLDKLAAEDPRGYRHEGLS